MNRTASVAAALMGLLLMLPALAQAGGEPDAMTEEAAPAEATEEAAPAEEVAPAEEAAVAEEAPPVEEAPPAEEMAAEEVPAEETASEDSGEPFQFYVGVDKAEVDFSLSNDSLETEFGGDDFDSSMYRLRVGMRLLEAVGLEAHYGFADDKDDEAGKIEIAEYYGLFLVPTGSLFDVVEISTPIGYSYLKGERGDASHKFDGVSYGLNLEVPITIGSEWIPDIRIGGGGLVYQAAHESRVYGYHFGVRLDFKI